MGHVVLVVRLKKMEVGDPFCASELLPYTESE